MHASPPAAATDEELRRTAGELRAEWGVEARRIRPVACRLADGRWHEAGALVREHAVSRRTVESVLARLRPWLEERDRRFRVAPSHREAMAAAWDCAASPPPPADRLESAMAELLRGLPAPDRNLDHVQATPATAARRALLLAESFYLAGATVVCLGDRDLTSLAIAQACPEAEVEVVDVDERVLEHVDRVASERGWRVRALFADLRVEVPPSLRERGDLVFTDPPYAPAGVRLFLARGVAALRPRDVGRVLFCYGFGERHPALGLKVQEVLHGLHLVAEAILPGFNRYEGAEALGGASSLYVCRPTRRTWAAAGRAAARDPRIYSRGESAVTAGAASLPPDVVERVRELLSGEAGATVVGEGWPEGLGAGLAVHRYLDDIRSPRGRPPFTDPPHPGVVAVNLAPHLGGYLPRVMLSAAARRVVAVVRPEAARELLSGRLASLVGVRYTLARLDGELPVVVADRRSEAADGLAQRVLRVLLDRPAATLGSAWREALIATLAAEGRAVTKNQARAAIAGTSTGARYAGCRVTELPLHRLRSLADEVERSLEALG